MASFFKRNVKNSAFFFKNVLFIQKVILNLKTIKNKVYESNGKNNDQNF